MKRVIILSTALLASLYAAEPKPFEVSAVAGGVFPVSDTPLADQFVYGGEIQYNADYYFVPELQILQSYETGYTDFSSRGGSNSVLYTTYLTRIGLNAVHDFWSKDSGFVPFYKLGVGYETLNDTHYFENDDSAYVDLGFGAKYFFYHDRFAVKVEGLYMQKLNDPHYDINLGILGGITYAFGGDEPAPVEAAAGIADQDGDGVADDCDKCPDTPKCVQVDATGCPLDSDHDGVPDMDDKCPNTPAGVKVDASGCPIDSDGDGVPDSLDKCPDTPAGVAVDASGCPIDSDGDGVPDSADKCPNSAKGFAVDSDGCEIAPVIHTNFKYNSFTVPAADAAKVQTYGQFLKRNGFGVKVIGYTDSVGSEAYNKKLSEKRAGSVAKIIKEQGVPADRVFTEGRGESNPVASNSTEEGRAQNRRVEFERLP